MNDIGDCKIGSVFGMWTVIGSSVTAPSGEKKYPCRCNCGTERYVLERSLRYGGSKSCGCIARQRAKEKLEHKLYGKVFGEFTIIDKAEKSGKNGGTYWKCVCSCGKTAVVSGTLLVNGRKTHCGCKSDPKYAFADITDKRYRFLVAKYPLKERDGNGSVMWHCVCDCGNEVDVSYNTLTYTGVCSCGCWKKERESKLSELITRVDGTSIDMIKSKKTPSDNTTGVKGVYYQRGKWIAKIVFQKKQYYLGTYETIEEAARVRKSAEVVLFDGVVSYWEKWNSLAEKDPVWADENHVRIFVQKREKGELEVCILPDLG